MTNLEKIRNYSVEELAEYLVHTVSINIGDENFDGEWEDYYIDEWETPNGIICYSYEEAIEETVNWLLREEGVEDDES